MVYPVIREVRLRPNHYSCVRLVLDVKSTKAYQDNLGACSYIRAFKSSNV